MIRSMNHLADQTVTSEPSDLGEARREKRPRVRKACLACKKRKTSCSGEDPCKRCRQEAIECDYNVVDGRTTKRKKHRDSTTAALSSELEPSQYDIRQVAGTESRGSVDIAFDDQQHTGAASGLAFLHEAVNIIEHRDASSSARNKNGPTQSSISIFTSGDVPFAVGDLENLKLPSIGTSRTLLLRYFDFATPSYRFFHRPTVESWAKELLILPKDDNQNYRRLTVAQKAIVFLLWAQALEYRVENEDSALSHLYYAKARELIDSEPGPPGLESVQVRLALCLYLLSTSRINECWYTFGTATFIVMAVGLHRKHSQSNSIDLIESECRKRAFWSAYILDRYLSVMKGRPRVFRDDEIDQEYPVNVSDDDMIYTDVSMLQHLPQHGLMETTINHAKLASIMGRVTDLLYPLRASNEVDVLQRAETMIDELDTWESDLPVFLKPSKQTLTGSRIFERQNSVLKLAHAHVRIMITRLFILGSFATLGQHEDQDDSNHAAQRHVGSCLQATYTIIDTVDSFVSCDALIRGFWFTQYIALCAISTLYIYVIHNHIDPSLLPLVDGKNYFIIAERCQQYLSSKAPANSPNKRYLVLLSRLRRKARQPFSRTENTQQPHTAAEKNALDDTHMRSYGVMSHTPNNDSRVDMIPLIQLPLESSTVHDFSLDDNFGVESVTTSGSLADFDAIPLSWGYLDQLSLPETYDYTQLSNPQY